MNDFLKIITGGLLLYFLWPRKKPKPVRDPDQDGMPSMDADAEEMFHDHIQLMEKCPKGFLEVSVMPKEGVFETAILPGLCLIGSAVLDGPVHAFSKYAKSEAADLQRGYDIMRELANAPYVTFILENDSSGDSTVRILDSNDSFDPDAFSGQVTGLMNFDGADDLIGLSAAPDLTGSKKVTFRCWLDKESGFTSVTPDMLFTFGDTNTDKLFVGLRGAFLYVNPSNTGSQVMTFSLAGWGDQVLDIEITKILNGTPEGEVTSCTINGIDQTLGNPGNAGATGAPGDVIGASSGASGLLVDATVWSIKVFDQTGAETLIHEFPGNPAGNTDAAWDDTVGVLTASVQGSPGLRNVNINQITTPPSGGDSDDPAVGFQSDVTYDQINRDFSVNPIKAFHLKLITTTDAQLLQPLTIVNSMVTGGIANRFIRIQDYIFAANKQRQVVDIPLKEIYVDRNTSFDLVLIGNETVTLIFYYQQMDPMDKILPVDSIIPPPL